MNCKLRKQIQRNGNICNDAKGREKVLRPNRWLSRFHFINLKMHGLMGLPCIISKKGTTFSLFLNQNFKLNNTKNLVLAVSQKGQNFSVKKLK